MASGIHDYSWPTQIHTMVTAYSLNDIIEAEVKIHFDLKRLPKRTSTMIRNNFKRGYKLAEGYGKVNSMTAILCEQFNIPRLPYINKYGARFYEKDDEFKKWFFGMGVVMEIDTWDTEQTSSEFSYMTDPKNHDLTQIKLMHQYVKRKYKETITANQRELYAEAIEALDLGAVITRSSEYYCEE